jgi:Ras-related protein Rab-1A
MADAHDYLAKIVLTGGSQSGKTSILAKFTDRLFPSQYIATIGVDFAVKTLNINGKSIKLQIWDSAGQERFRSITAAYYRGAHAIMLVCDVTSEQSYSDLSDWMEEVKKYGHENVEVLLVANKSDLEEERCVTEQQCQQFAIQHDLDVMYVSAKTGENINEAFETLAKSVLSRIEQDVPPA